MMRNYLRIGCLVVSLFAVANVNNVYAEDNWVVAWEKDNAKPSVYSKTDKAVSLLSEYYDKVTGKKLEVKEFGSIEQTENIFLIVDAENLNEVDKSKFSKTARDSVMIKYPYNYKKKTVCLLASYDHCSSDYPVYYFLSTFMDFHWIGPGELGEVYSKIPNWKIPDTIDVFEEPDFEMRTWATPDFTGRQWLAWSGRMHWHHNIGSVFHPNKYGKKYPEVYPMLKNGKRFIPDSYIGWQPCVSNPKSIEIAKEYVLDLLRKDERVLTASLSVNDGIGQGLCMCEGCRKLDPPGATVTGDKAFLTDRFFTFYNKVMEEVLKVNPDASIAVFAYPPVKLPPSRVKVHPNIQVFHVYQSTEQMVAWGKMGGKASLHYWLWDGGFLSVVPEMEYVSEQIRIAKILGGKGFYTETITMWPAAGPRLYALAKVLWDTDVKMSDAYMEYFTLCYGDKAAPHIQKYFQRWAEMYKRFPKADRHSIGTHWKKLSQFKHFRWSDFSDMRTLLNHAEKCGMTIKQRERFEYLLTLHALYEVNAKQVLSAKDLNSSEWISGHTFDEMAKVIQSGMEYTDDFNTLWKTRIELDASGWLAESKYVTDKRYINTAQSLWNIHYKSLRASVVSAYFEGSEAAIHEKAQDLTLRQGKGAARRFLDDQLQKYPDLATFIKPEIDRIDGVSAGNIVKNGDFEKGVAKTPIPVLDDWIFYQNYGTVKATENVYSWTEDAERGGKVIGLGHGGYSEFRSWVKLEKDTRYRLSVSYKTINRKTGPRIELFSYAAPMVDLKDINYSKISLFSRHTLEETNGEWKKLTTSVQTDEGGNAFINIAGDFQAPGEWIYLDDLEIIKLYSLEGDD